MKCIRIGLTGNQLISLKHSYLEIFSKAPSVILAGDDTQQTVAHFSSQTVVHLRALGNTLQIDGHPELKQTSLQTVRFKGKGVDQHFYVQFPNKSAGPRLYDGELSVTAEDGAVRIFLTCTLENYVTGVLGSEIPASYHLEAIKAQAVAARTYGLNPRVDHTPDHCQVCDSFLCCQAFVGERSQINSKYTEAIDQTKELVIVYDDKPILALFSSCAGGHTEDYSTCFSDRKTNAFPPEPIPYLQGVAEGLLPVSYGISPSDKALAALWHAPKPETVDAWAPQFKWSVRLTSDALEAHMHHVIATLSKQEDVTPFIIPPPSQIFGHIDSFRIGKRGSGGTAISMAIDTSKGTWIIKKELVIRSVFQNPQVKLARLKSARVYFEHEHDRTGLLSALSIHGLGTGHGVGLQQTGAEGLARFKGRNYRQIIDHYFKGVQIAKI